MPTLARYARFRAGNGRELTPIRGTLTRARFRVHFYAGGGTRTPDTRIMIPADFGLTTGHTGQVDTPLDTTALGVDAIPRVSLRSARTARAPSERRATKSRARPPASV